MDDNNCTVQCNAGRRIHCAKLDECKVYKSEYSLPGMQHRQLVTIAALTESNSGSTININSATPIVCNDSIKKMKRKCDRCGRFHDLKKQIRMARMNEPISGSENAMSNAHIHATRSSSGNTETNDLSRPCKLVIWMDEFSKLSNVMNIDKLYRLETYQIFITIW